MTGDADNCDGFAIIYNRHWGSQYAQVALDTLELLLLSRIPTGARISELLG